MDDNEGKVLSLPQAPDAIELRHLRAFVAVAEELNFGRAATRLYLSQPALSRQIRTLERLVGCDLLRRSTHQVELTLAGEALVDRARRILGDLDDAVYATQSVGGELAGRIARLWEPLGDLSAADADLEDVRVAYEALHAQFQPLPEVDLRPVNAGGVPSLLLVPPSCASPTLLYLHGGGFITGSAFGYRALAGALAAAGETAALVPDYRLAPEHPFPAAVEDAVRAYLWILDRGADPKRVTVAGDSSGGGQLMSLLISLKLQDLPLPGGAVLFCPGISFAPPPRNGAKMDPEAAEADKWFRFAAAAYLGGHSTDDPVVNPLLADLAGMPPMLIQAATGDICLEDARLLADHAREDGVDARPELYPVAAHVFHVFWSFLPEASDALRQAGRFIREVHSIAGATSTGVDAVR
jgi:acetyl esterase/lipase